MLDCFDGLITLDDTCAGNDADALPLQSIGINETFLAAITGKEDMPDKLLAQVETWARNYLGVDVLTRYGSQVRATTMVDRMHLGELSQDPVTAPLLGTRGGIVIEINPASSNLAAMLLSIAYNGTAQTVTVYDLSDGSTVTTIAGVSAKRNIRLALPANARKSRYLIATDGTDYGNVLLPGAASGCGSCGDGWTSGVARAYGSRLSTALPVITSNLNTVGHTSGLSVDITVACDHAQWLCEMRASLALPYLYKVGQGIMDRAMQAGDRMNNVVSNEKLLAARAEQYQAEYEKAIGAIVNRAVVPSDGICFVCNSPSRIVTAIP